MDNVIKIADLARGRTAAHERDGGYEDFLISEGLVLLATYRSIDDEDLRRKVQVYAEDMARLDAAARHPTSRARSRPDAKPDP